MLIAIDPSINKTGYAIVTTGRNDDNRISGVIKSVGVDDFQKLLSIKEGIERVILEQAGRGKVITIAAIELPSGFSYARSTSKFSGTALNRSAINKLNMAIGAIAATLMSHNIAVKPVFAHQWKGKRTKQIDKSIAKNITGKEKMSSDEADAVMLAEYAKIYFNLR